jgi:hypothetical protein
MVLKKPQPTVVQIGSVQNIKSAAGPAPTSILVTPKSAAPKHEQEEVGAPSGD